MKTENENKMNNTVGKFKLVELTLIEKENLDSFL